MINTLIIPDVHGRDFWIEPVEECLKNENIHIIFLGDYHDIYPYEWKKNTDANKISIERFKQIIALKQQYPNRITLLIGNHDCFYAIGHDVCSCRADYKNRNEIEKLFSNNRKLFQIAEEKTINNKHFVFSHAGILKGWAERVWGEEEINKPTFNIINELNNAWLVDHYGILHSLGIYDSYRGWGGYKYGSPVWSDIRSWENVKPEDTYGFNIVGHTQCANNPIILNNIIDLDCRKPFYIDEN